MTLDILLFLLNHYCEKAKFHRFVKAIMIYDKGMYLLNVFKNIVALNSTIIYCQGKIFCQIVQLGNEFYNYMLVIEMLNEAAISEMSS